jgi:hypothetical protein
VMMEIEYQVMAVIHRVILKLDGPVVEETLHGQIFVTKYVEMEDHFIHPWAL